MPLAAQLQVRHRYAIAVCLVTAIAVATAGDWSRAPDPASARAPGTFVVMTFNVQHGMDGRGRYRLQAAADAIARVSPDIVGVQEVTRNHPAYDCDDQPRRLAEALQAATGRRWSSIYQQEWFTPDRSCERAGRGDGPETEGLAFLSPHALERVGHVDLWKTRIGLAAGTPAIPGVTFIVTHLASGRRATADRTSQLEQLLAWAERMGDRRVLLGDFNAEEESAEMRRVRETYQDAWLEARRRGLREGIDDGRTRSDRPGRIDYVLFAADSPLRLIRVETIETSGWFSAAASDHNPVAVTFTRE